ncbi:ATP-binding protein [Ornithobacterium rhinotracheale]|uniref:ORC1/DEAH AAA+ ATPase domain-containing protein n=1 Tax=Ornithobacterium rhinotracheale (strain ATCC 51463 / DSM 15997 / CCUG 23171 / CIP 104009 / LMG 9086) TaxID=867902 RepID=I4A369_ORNRL|nr:ATP-binding protein [Ornithobacterium rhinotracheale]AFL98403.1 hypothetical protein Ornrh_2272 [Ornithobacterium rhinotracheale DSM 15997]AIQ00756.1 hypothetical protein Q785_11510 [Ornithobacterium rhinotracheale ORT-UMN 88]KGB65851.1 hypothetical protein Q787_11040 [Ornithobacterium rhinotracheale H06-030791]MCK0193249.1 AAA family ATPase [Ornithobacterium rhinotracheale]MCK0201121.1 AAA family ATPase [Ornithobacterium rhinotracheale]
MTKLSIFQKTEQIPVAVERYMENTGAKQPDVAKISGVGLTYVNQILQRKTHIGKTAIKDVYYLGLAKAIGLDIRVSYWQHFDTANFQQIINKIKEVRESGERATIDGDTGSGKTHALRQYITRYPNNTFIVTCSAVENAKEFAVNIGEVVGVETFGTAGTIIKKVVKKLLMCDNPILIIDEAEHIGKKTGYINIIKTLADGLDGKVGFLLVGMGINEILKKGYERNKQNFRQTARRFGRRENLITDITEDIDKICSTLELSQTVANWLKKRVQNFGDLEIIIKDAFAEAEKSNQAVNVELLNTLYI